MGAEGGWGARAGQGAHAWSRTPCVCAHTLTRAQRSCRGAARGCLGLSSGRPGRAGGAHGIDGAPRFHPADRRADTIRALLALYRGHPAGPPLWTPVPWGRRRARRWAGRRSEPLCVSHPASRFGVRGASIPFPAAGTDVSHRRPPSARLGLCCAPSRCRARLRPPVPFLPASRGRMEHMELPGGGGGGFGVAGPQQRTRAAIPGACHGTSGETGRGAWIGAVLRARMRGQEGASGVVRGGPGGTHP